MKKLIFFFALAFCFVSCSAQLFPDVSGAQLVSKPQIFSQWVSIAPYSTSQMPSASACPRCEVYNTDSLKLAVSNGSSWVYQETGSGTGSLYFANLQGSPYANDSLANIFAAMMKYSDTTYVFGRYLSGYLTRSDSAELLQNYALYAQVVKYADTGEPSGFLTRYALTANMNPTGVGLGNVLNRKQVINLGGFDSVEVLNFLSFPSANVGPSLVYAPDSNALYYNNKSAYTKISGGNGGSGSDDSTHMASRYYVQTNFYPLNSNPDGYMTDTAHYGVLLALGYTPYNASNPNGYINANQVISFAPTGPVIVGATTGSTSLAPDLTIATNQVSYAMLQQSVGKTLIGNQSSSTANNGPVYVRSGMMWNADSLQADTSLLVTRRILDSLATANGNLFIPFSDTSGVLVTLTYGNAHYLIWADTTSILATQHYVSVNSLIWADTTSILATQHYVSVNSLIWADTTSILASQFYVNSHTGVSQIYAKAPIHISGLDTVYADTAILQTISYGQQHFLPFADTSGPLVTRSYLNTNALLWGDTTSILATQHYAEVNFLPFADTSGPLVTRSYLNTNALLWGDTTSILATQHYSSVHFLPFADTTGLLVTLTYGNTHYLLWGDTTTYLATLTTLADSTAAIRNSTFGLYVVQGLKVIGTHLDSIGWGGTLIGADTLNTAYFPLLIQDLPSKSTALTTDSAVLSDQYGQLWKVPFTAGGNAGDTVNINIRIDTLATRLNYVQTTQRYFRNPHLDPAADTLFYAPDSSDLYVRQLQDTSTNTSILISKALSTQGTLIYNLEVDTAYGFTWTAYQKFNAGFQISSSIGLGADNTYSFGSNTVGMGNVWSHAFASPTNVLIQAVDSTVTLEDANGWEFILLNSGQGRLTKYTSSTAFAGTGIAFIENDASGNLIQLPVSSIPTQIGLADSAAAIRSALTAYATNIALGDTAAAIRSALSSYATSIALGDTAAAIRTTLSSYATHTAIVDTAAAIRASTNSGTYTATLGNTTNVTSSTFYSATYLFSGNVVYVTVQGVVTPTTALTLTALTISLPFTTTFSSAYVNAGGGIVQMGTTNSIVNALTQLASSTTVTMFFTPTSSGIGVSEGFTTTFMLYL